MKIPLLITALVATPALGLRQAAEPSEASAQAPAAAPVPQGPGLVSPALKTAADTITAAEMRAHIRFLASDLLEGRGPATRGDALAEAYIASQMEGMGLEPVGPDGTYLQAFDVVGTLSHPPATLRVSGPQGSKDLAYYEDYMGVAGDQQPRTKIDGAEIVFVGYGIVAPEFAWDDYKGADLKGKVLLMMNDNPEEFGRPGEKKTRLAYGRWDYKYASAAKQGALGAIIIHTTPSAGYPWQVVQGSWSGENFALPPSGQPLLKLLAWATEPSCQALAKLGGQDLDALRAQAGKRDFKPVPLGVTLGIDFASEIQTKRTANVLGLLRGSDPLLSKEAVLYTAHHDHLGMRPQTKPGEDTIYNGALDNASGVASMLSIARAFKRLKTPPKRSILFAAVAAEEQGLLGSQYLAAHPPFPPGRIAADINIDGINIWGRTHDVVMVGLNKSSLDNYIRAIAQMQGRVLNGDPEPDKGYFYRSDQVSFARIGVPAAFFDAGIETIGKPPGWGKAARDKFEETDYHQPSDELRPGWDFGGAVEDAQLCFFLGAKVAASERLPAWRIGDEFEAARKKALQDVGGPISPNPPKKVP
jgi:Zn-dependent M28 family amino/carboxypeptidase